MSTALFPKLNITKLSGPMLSTWCEGSPAPKPSERSLTPRPVPYWPSPAFSKSVPEEPVYAHADAVTESPFWLKLRVFPKLVGAPAAPLRFIVVKTACADDIPAKIAIAG